MQTLSSAACGSGKPAHGRQAVQALPDLLGHERHDRVEQAAEAVEQRRQHALGDRAGRRVAEPALDELEVPVAEVAPGEVAELPGRLGELELLEVRSSRRAIVRSRPSRIQRSSIGRSSRSIGGRLVALQVHQGEPGGVPELVGEVAPLLEPLGGVDDAAVGELELLDRASAGPGSRWRRRPG